MNEEALCRFLLNLEGTSEAPHFDRIAFKVKRIFTTLHLPSQTINVKLTPADQQVFCQYNPVEIYPVPNKWGLQGWTTCHFEKVPEALLTDLLQTAYQLAL